MPRLSLRMHNSSAVESESSYGSPTAVSKAHRLPLLPLSPQQSPQSPPPVSPPPKQSSQSNGRSRMKLAQSNGHVHFQSFRKEEEEDDDHEDETSAKKEVGAGDDDDDDDEELYLDAVDHLLHSPEDDLRKVSGSEDIASSSSSNVTTTTYVNKDTSVSGDCGGGGSRASAGADGSVQQQSYDNDEDDSLKMEVDDRFEQAVVGALPSPPERHSTLKKVSAQSAATAAATVGRFCLLACFQPSNRLQFFICRYSYVFSYFLICLSPFNPSSILLLIWVIQQTVQSSSAAVVFASVCAPSRRESTR